MPLSSSAEESGAAGGIFPPSPFSFLLLFQATPVASSQVFPSIFSPLRSFVQFLVCVLRRPPRLALSDFSPRLIRRTRRLPLSSETTRFDFRRPRNIRVIYIRDQAGL